VGFILTIKVKFYFFSQEALDFPVQHAGLEFPLIELVAESVIFTS
jgi:hypothetical protein